MLLVSYVKSKHVEIFTKRNMNDVYGYRGTHKFIHFFEEIYV